MMNTFGDFEPVKRQRLSETEDTWIKPRLNLDTVIEQLTDREVLRGERPRLSEFELIWLANHASECFQNEPVCLSLTLDRPICIVGDLFGQYNLLVHLFQRCGYPPKRAYLFLGNFVNRGRRSIETLCLLFTLKLRYPKHVYILRGAHECSSVAYYYGLYRECAKTFTPSLWEAITSAFDYMPAVAVIENTMFCVSSGLPHYDKMEQLDTQDELLTFISDRIFRPNRVFDCDMMAQLAWSEPLLDSYTWKPNDAGLGWWYPESAVETFCEKFCFQQVVRGNCMLPRGYEFMANDHLLNIYTSPYTFGHWRGYGAMAILTRHSEHLVGRIVLLHFDTLAAVGRPNVLTVIFTDSLGSTNNMIDVLEDRVVDSEIDTDYNLLPAGIQPTNYKCARLTSLSASEDCYDDEEFTKDEEEGKTTKRFLPKMKLPVNRRR